MSLISRPFLAPIKIAIPWDPAIDAEAWGMTADEYLERIVTADEAVPLPPVRPGQTLATLTMAPLGYSAYAYALHLIGQAGEQWPYDAALQAHVLRHAIVDCGGLSTEDGPVRVRREDGPYGPRLTAESWSQIGFFCDLLTWGTLAVACVARSARQRYAPAD